MDRKKALYVREPFLIKIKSERSATTPHKPPADGTGRSTDCFCQERQAICIGNDKPIEEAKTGKRSFLPRTKTDMAAAGNSQKTESCCYKIRGNRKGLSDIMHAEVR